MEEPARVHSKSKHRSSSSRHREHRKKDLPIKNDDETNVGVEAGINDENSAVVIDKDVIDQTSISIENEIKSEDKIQKGILGYMDRQLKVQATPEPPRSPAQRSTRSNDKSPKHKRSRDKSESRRRRERKLQAAGEMEVRQANETLMRYLKQCSDLNEASASLSGDLEISENLDDRRVHRKTKSQREKKSFRLIGQSQPSDLTTILNELNDDIIPNNEIYNPFTPVVSPTEQHGQVIDKIFVQTSNGYRACDNNSFYKNATTDGGVSNSSYSIKNAVQLSCHVQKMWINISNVCHGLLGGLALAHMLFILTTKPEDWSGTESSIEHYAMHAKIYTNLFFFLAVICFVSILDRIDICQFSMFNSGNEKTNSISFRSVIMIMIYAGTIVLNLSAGTLDERFYLPHLATETNATLIAQDAGKEDLDPPDMVYLWNTLSIARSLLAIFGWLMVSASNTDQLYNLLMELDKYHVHP